MSHRPHPIPVGILVSVSGPRRRRKFRALADFPPIKKEVSLPLRVGLGAVAVLSVLILGVCTYSVLAEGPATVIAAVAQPVNLLPNFRPDPAPVAPARDAARAQQPVGDAPAAPGRMAAGNLWAAWFNQAAPQNRPTADARPQADPPPSCSTVGTQISFLHHPPDAFRQAAREQKLVLMVHLSGNFEDQGFT